MSVRIEQVRIGRTPSYRIRMAIPIAATMLGSLLIILPMISTTTLLPPFGLLFLLAWRMLHRTMWPTWMPLVLGLFDDLFSGQPLGSSMLLWTLTFFALDALDRRMLWRDFWQDWLLAGALILAVQSGQLAIANMTGGSATLLTLLPQLITSILLYPLVVRICVMLDGWRYRL